MKLSLDETETHLNLVGSDRETWHVYSDDVVMQRRLESNGATLVKAAKSGGKYYTLPSNHISFRKPRKLSDEQRAQMAARMVAARKG